ncbi:unnamed protein product [Lactuca virosa]|uniref:Very-long-chain (3R)-3-hydroxyacyl-CoA dehydratase n=1 Tax=Lactuca virosa TaxID=75947 RepID=A0AAU9PQI8_9ASTR|nr:unnamed protein product [Lactuca virosa]
MEVGNKSEGTEEVPGLSEVLVYKTYEVWELLKSGSRVRSVGSTNANELSSQSHWLRKQNMMRKKPKSCTIIFSLCNSVFLQENTYVELYKKRCLTTISEKRPPLVTSTSKLRLPLRRITNFVSTPNFSKIASNKFKIVQTHPIVSSLVISWSITEIIRYSFFGTKEAFGSTPHWLLWIRYSTFLVLYPTGISSEIAMIYNALPYMKESEKYSIRMPNKWNFSFDYFYFAVVVLAAL